MNNINADIVVPVNPSAPERNLQELTNSVKELEQEVQNIVPSIFRSGTFANKPAAADIYVGFLYFCTDKQTVEGATDGIEIIHKGNDVWVDALGRVVN